MTKFMFCPKCGCKIVDSSWRFCPVCGYELTEEFASKNTEIEDVFDDDLLNISEEDSLTLEEEQAIRDEIQRELDREKGDVVGIVKEGDDVWIVREEDALTPEEEQAIRDEIQQELDRENGKNHFLNKMKPFLIDESNEPCDSFDAWTQGTYNQIQTTNIVKPTKIDLLSIRKASLNQQRFDEAERLYEAKSYPLARECYKNITQEHPSDLTAWWGLVKTEIAASFLSSQSRNLVHSIELCSHVFQKVENPFHEEPLQVLLRLTNNLSDNHPEVKAIKSLLDQKIVRIREQIEIVIEAILEDKLTEEEQKSMFTQKHLKLPMMYATDLYDTFNQVIAQSFENVKTLEKHPCYSYDNLRQLFGYGYRIHQCFDSFCIQIDDGYPRIQPYGYAEIKETLDELMTTYEINNRCLVCGAKLKLFSDKCSKNEKHKATRRG